MSTLNEALIVKPCKPPERSFYEALAKSSMAFLRDEEVDMEVENQLPTGPTSPSRSPSPFEALRPWIRDLEDGREERDGPLDPARFLPIDRAHAPHDK
jgi:hypothetical protein